MTAAREWTPYGVEVDGAQAGLGYAGEWFDADVEAQYLRARWYDVATGRFTQRDTLFGSPVYHYSSDNPINRVDPSGHIDWSACTINGIYGTCVIEQGDTLYKIARELQGAGIESQAGLSKVVGDIIGYNPAIQGNPNYIKMGDSLTLPAEWISALQTSPTMDAVVITLEPLPPYLPPGVLETSCFPGCDEGMPPDPVVLWREPVSTLGELMGHPAIDNVDTVLQTFEHGIRGMEGGLIPQGEVYNFVAQLAKDANVDTCLANRFARGGFVVIEQGVVTAISVQAGSGLGMLTGTGAAALTGGNLGAFGAGYIVEWAGGYFGSYHIMTIGVNDLNEDVFFPWLEDLLCE